MAFNVKDGASQNRTAANVGADTVNAQADLLAEIERLKAENASLKATGTRGITLRISAKGALSVYGMGRFPVTLYREQWERLLDAADQIRAFIKANIGSLSSKDKETKAA